MHRDNQIITLIRNADRRSQNDLLEQIYFEHIELITTFVRNNGGTEEDAKDVYQDAILVMYMNAKSPNFKLTCNMGTYLYSISRNIWFPKLKRGKRMVGLSADYDVVEVDQSALEILEENEKKETLSQLIDQLGEGCKKILTYFYFEKLPMREIVQKMNLSSEQIAKNKKYNCMKKLKLIVKDSVLFAKVFK